MTINKEAEAEEREVPAVSEENGGAGMKETVKEAVPWIKKIAGFAAIEFLLMIIIKACTACGFPVGSVMKVIIGFTVLWVLIKRG